MLAFYRYGWNITSFISLIHFARGYNIILLTIYEGIKYNCDINLPLSSSAKHYNTLTTDKLDFGAYLS